MVHMYLKTVTQTKPSIALNNFPEYIPDHIRFELVTASQTNAYHLILHILGITDPQAHQIPIRHFVN
jgi:uncharacterized membrane protein YecN with MAPEG domain